MSSAQDLQTSLPIIEFKFAFKVEFFQFLYEVEPNLKSFTDAMKPLEKFSAALATNNFDMTEKIFSYLPPLVEEIRKDIKFPKQEKARRPNFAIELRRGVSV